MSIFGTVRNGTIQIDSGNASLPNGARVRIEVESSEKDASPKVPETIHAKTTTKDALLALHGTLSDEEAEEWRRGIAAAKQIDPKLWDDSTF